MENSFRTSLDLNSQVPRYSPFSQQNSVGQSRPSPSNNQAAYAASMDIDQPSDTHSMNQTRSHSGSEQNTPSNSSNHPSSHTSYSPNNPNIDDSTFASFDVTVSNQDSQNPVVNRGMSHGPLGIAETWSNDFSLSYQDMLANTQDLQPINAQPTLPGKENPFDFNGSWNQSVDGQNARTDLINDANAAQGMSTGMTPKDVPELGSGTGMTPLNIDDPSQWGQVLDNMGWNGWRDAPGAA